MPISPASPTTPGATATATEDPAVMVCAHRENATDWGNSSSFTNLFNRAFACAGVQQAVRVRACTARGLAFPPAAPAHAAAPGDTAGLPITTDVGLCGCQQSAAALLTRRNLPRSCRACTRLARRPQPLRMLCPEEGTDTITWLVAEYRKASGASPPSGHIRRLSRRPPPSWSWQACLFWAWGPLGQPPRAGSCNSAVSVARLRFSDARLLPSLLQALRSWWILSRRARWR